MALVEANADEFIEGYSKKWRPAIVYVDFKTYKTVKKEIEEYKKEHKELSLEGYFNNFYSKLPKGWLRDWCNERESLDLVPDGNSKKTYRQFFEDIDSAVHETGIDMEEMRRLQEKINIDGDHGAQYELNRSRLNIFSFPVYIKVRDMGYSFSELYA